MSFTKFIACFTAPLQPIARYLKKNSKKFKTHPKSTPWCRRIPTPVPLPVLPHCSGWWIECDISKSINKYLRARSLRTLSTSTAGGVEIVHSLRQIVMNRRLMWKRRRTESTTNTNWLIKERKLYMCSFLRVGLESIGIRINKLSLEIHLTFVLGFAVNFGCANKYFRIYYSSKLLPPGTK